MIPFNKPFLTGNELPFIAEAYKKGQISGDGFYTKECSNWLEKNIPSQKVLLTHSCTAALEMAAILADIKNGDEIIMPSFTFSSTANAFALRGGIPVFVDIRKDTLNIDEKVIEAAITSRTKAIVPVHYAGNACEMDEIKRIANRFNLLVIEDAAQGFGSNYKGKALGSIGDFGTYSFHETKTIVSGEGGALLINDPKFNEKAEIIREKGTNRSKFFRGQVDKYTWADIGSSYLPGEIISAFLWAQLQEANEIVDKRKNIWNKYHQSFEPLEMKGRIRRPTLTSASEHNAHIYYLLLQNRQDRDNFIDDMKSEGIHCTFHYIPLHSSPAGLKYGRADNDLMVTLEISDRIVRIPIYLDLTEEMQKKIINSTIKILSKKTIV
jgi:dTDP-4-amino-4,6-dideoxygalactose transaminase